MKHLTFLFLFVLLTVTELKAQTLPLDSITKKVTFQETINADSLTQEILYDRTIEWMANFFKNSKFDINDKANGKVGSEGYFVINLTYDFKYKSENNVSYNLLINQKEGKYKYLLTDFSIYNVKTGPKSSQPVEVAFNKMTLQNKKEFLNQLNTQVKQITDELKESINTGKIKNTEEWK